MSPGIRRALASFAAAAIAATASGAGVFAQPQALAVTYSRQAPDSQAVVKRARQLQSKFERQRRQMLPRFYSGGARRCVIIGRFCYWDDDIPNDAVPEEGANIRRARARFLRDLEEAAKAVPGDDWIAGQRVRYHVEAHDTLAVEVARSCAATRWWCDALTGYALHAAGDFAAADSAFSAALDGMPGAMHCHWINVAPLLDSDRREYRRLPCDERKTLVRRIWWLADPLLMVPGNDRRTEHFSRVLHTMLVKDDGISAFGGSWGGDLAELTVRFGWPEKWTQQPLTGMQTTPAISGHDRDGGAHFFPNQWPPDSLALVADSIWQMDRSPAQEVYGPSYARSFARLDAQVARFRRGDSTLIVAAYDVAADTLFRARKLRAALVAMGDETSPPAAHEVAEAQNRQVLTVTTPWKSQLIGVELLAHDSAGAARWRSGFSEIPLEPGRISVSDLLFVEGAPSLPGSLAEAIPRAHGGTEFARNTKIGLFWELYGEAPADSALPVSLTISPLETGLLRSALGVLRVAPRPTPLNVRWQDNGASGVLSARSLLLDLSLLPSGKYEVRLDVGTTRIATTRRVIRIR